MELEHIIAAVVIAPLSLLALWLVWWFLCRRRENGDEEDIKREKNIKNTQLITRAHSGHRNDQNLTDDDLSDDEGNSRYILRPEALSDPFGVWSPKESKHSNPRSSYKTIYPKSPSMKRARQDILDV